MLPWSAFKGAILFNYLCLIYGPDNLYAIMSRCTLCWSIWNNATCLEWKQILLSLLAKNPPKPMWFATIGQVKALNWLFVGRFWVAWHFTCVKSSQAIGKPAQTNHRCENAPKIAGRGQITGPRSPPYTAWIMTHDKTKFLPSLKWIVAQIWGRTVYAWIN